MILKEKFRVKELIRGKNNISYIEKLPFIKLQQKMREHMFYLSNSMFEGTPKSLLEAMSNELYVIARSAPGVNEVFRNSKSFLLANSTKDIVEQVKKLNGSYPSNLIKESKKYLENYHSLQGYINLYKNEIYSCKLH